MESVRNGSRLGEGKKKRLSPRWKTAPVSYFSIIRLLFLGCFGAARSTVALAGSLLVTVGLFIAIGLLFAARFISLAVGLTVCLAIRLAVFALAVGAFAGLTIGFTILTLAVGTLALFFAALCLSLVAVGSLGDSRCGNYRSSGNTGQEKKFLHITIRLISFDANIVRCVCESRVVNLIFSKKPVV